MLSVPYTYIQFFHNHILDLDTCLLLEVLASQSSFSLGLSPYVNRKKYMWQTCEPKGSNSAKVYTTQTSYEI